MKKIILFTVLFGSIVAATPAYSYKNRIGLLPNIASFEHLQKNDLYYALEGFYNLIGTKCAQAEARIGYNFDFKDTDYLCPYFATGWLKGFRKTCDENNLFDHANIFFGALGLCYDHEILSIFHVGFRSELLMGSFMKNSQNELTYGFEGRVPMTFLFGSKGRCDFRFEPFAIFLSKKDRSSDLWGLLLSFGYKY
jgi:hypothetical protein